MNLNLPTFFRFSVLTAAAGLAVACDSSPSQPSVEDRQNAALKDPFSYGPTTPAANGKGAPVPENKERDESLNGEWKRFWNP